MSTREEFFKILQSGEVINYCYSYNQYSNTWKAYLMAQGSEQCMASYKFDSKEDIIDLYKSYGITYYFEI
jgi:hypothetical protein